MHPSTTPFVPGPQVHIKGRPDGSLSGLTFVAKDLFDVAGYPTGGGNHDWAFWRPVPDRHAWAVQTLLDAGATLVGKTITDEVSLGILGENAFDGTPLNPSAPDRVPGGSSRDRRRRSQAVSATRRSGQTREARFACRRASAASMASVRRMAASRLMGCCRKHRHPTRQAGSGAMRRHSRA